MKSIKERIAHRFKVSIAEVDDQELWQKVSLGVALAASNKLIIEQTFAKIETFLEQDDRIEILDFSSEISK